MLQRWLACIRFTAGSAATERCSTQRTRPHHLCCMTVIGAPREAIGGCKAPVSSVSKKICKVEFHCKLCFISSCVPLQAVFHFKLCSIASCVSFQAVFHCKLTHPVQQSARMRRATLCSQVLDSGSDSAHRCLTKGPVAICRPAGQAAQHAPPSGPSGLPSLSHFAARAGTAATAAAGAAKDRDASVHDGIKYGADSSARAAQHVKTHVAGQLPASNLETGGRCQMGSRNLPAAWSQTSDVLHAVSSFAAAVQVAHSSTAGSRARLL